MALNPGVGEAGGQKYPVLRSIQTFLGQMAEGGIRAAPAVLKELLQNADDAGATEVSVVLDERVAPSGLPAEYEALLGPAILFCNNQKFRLASDPDAKGVDDFSAICDVANGHKRANATAAGRFGIGFNSVYFLTDTPLLFSRREVHVFDLLHRVFEADGWRFSLDKFPSQSDSKAGPAKVALEWCFPKSVLASRSFSDIASDPSDEFQETVFRLPLRRSAEGAPALYPERFPDPVRREQLLTEMAEEATRSILLLKSLQRISLHVLRARELETVATIEVTASPASFEDFRRDVETEMAGEEIGRHYSCAFERVIRRKVLDQEEQVMRFHISHVACFDVPELHEMRKRLHLNGERAVPWAALAIPLDAAACRLDDSEAANWRVFLPLVEPGPSSCVMHGSFFVGPSRQKAEFKLDGSDEGMRRTRWNKTLAEHALVPLLRDISVDLPDKAPDLLENHPSEYVGLFPRAGDPTGEAKNLTDVVRAAFSSDLWALSLRDVWGERFEVLVGDSDETIVLEAVPDWLKEYTGRFRNLSTPQRRFLRRALLDAVASRVGSADGVQVVRTVAADSASAVLQHDDPPEARHLVQLLRSISEGEINAEALDGAWAFVAPGTGSLLRYRLDHVYMTEEQHGLAIVSHLRQIGLRFEHTDWVRGDAGLARLLHESRQGLGNVLRPDAAGAIELLRRPPESNAHDIGLRDHQIRPVVDFLIKHKTRLTPDLRLGFLVTTAQNKQSRRRLGVILLKPESPSTEEGAFWEVWFRKVFAEVDGQCARELRRLLKAAPICLDMLHADDCRVVIASASVAFELLHELRCDHPELYEVLQQEIAAASSEHGQGGSRRRDAERIANALLEYADANWEEMDEEQRMTVLALPIHRRPDGSFESLVPPEGGDLGDVRSRYRLQAEDDLFDAPLKLPDWKLLQTVNSTVRNFYRVRVKIETHGRVAVLKDVLEQIGRPEVDSERLLRYLAQYFRNKVGELERTGSEADLKDASELQERFAAARIVRCTDGSWQTIGDSSEAWRIADKLVGQEWPRTKLEWLVGELLADEYVASLDRSTREMLPSLCSLESHDPQEIASLAITSESSALTFLERVKLFIDNGREGSEPDARPAAAIREATLPTLNGRAALTAAELLGDTAGYPVELLRLLAPNGIDLQILSSETGTSVSQLSKALLAFGVPETSARELDGRMIEEFSDFWPSLSDGARLKVLGTVASRRLTESLREAAAAEDVVRSSGGTTGAWRKSHEMISPRWAESNPPFLLPGQLPAAAAQAVTQVWNDWCGIRTFGGVLAQVVQAASERAGDCERTAAELYGWIEKAVGPAPAEDDLTEMRGQPWVLGRQGDRCEYLRPGEVLLHGGERVLGARFWVPAIPLPTVATRVQERLGFIRDIPATAASLQLVAESLVERATVDADAVVQVYGLIQELIEDEPGLAPEWQRLADSHPVYRAFREPERLLTSRTAFLGDAEYREDMSHTLLCVKAESTLPKGLIGQYRALGVPDRPTLAHVVEAASALDMDHPGAEGSYSRLLLAIMALADSLPSALRADDVLRVRVLVCDGSYVPLSDCYWDDELGWRSRIAPESAGLLIDTRNGPTQRFAGWLRRTLPDAITTLRSAAELQLENRPVELELTPETSFLIQPWRQWIHEAQREGSALRDQLREIGLALPSKSLRLVAVDGIRMRFVTDCGESIAQLQGWTGPVALGLPSGEIFVQPLQIGSGRRGEESATDRFDELVAREIAIVLGGADVSREPAVIAKRILETLERPATVLRQLRDTYSEHFLHQYHDQVADPSFAELFDEYRRTSRGSRRAEELRERMYDLLAAGSFVRARREQIRGYGYNEFSVFAELIQNAEDAYAQREQLGMDMPNPCSIAYRFSAEGGGQVLTFEHRGRPFNYWQHGERQDPALSHDVEGVLRSAGSFKPHSTVENTARSSAKTIGRFGLGFKSVYLLTDRPEIYSGPWHFAIEAGCLPKQLTPPSDLAEDGTRIRIPLRDDVSELPEASDLAGLLPFLHHISDLEYTETDGSTTRVEVTAAPIRVTDSVVVERVTIKCPELGRGDSVQFLRSRSREHAGQIALLLSSESKPTRWDDAFERDLFAALPLRAELGCGVAVSHRFEVQSGRTHLVDPRQNQQRIAEVAALLEPMVAGLAAGAVDASIADSLQRFWSIWRWERGDTECLALRQALAGALAGVATRMPIVPTLDSTAPAMLGKTACFYFYEVPDVFRDALIDAHVAVPSADGARTALQRGNVVADGFATAYRRTCDFAGTAGAASLVAVGWNEVAGALRERPWLAEQPELLNKLAESLSEEQSRKAASWLSLCQIRCVNDPGGSTTLRPIDLLRPGFADSEHLPTRFLRCAAPTYSARALELLALAGLRERPTAEELRAWIYANDLSPAEAVGVLRYLSAHGRIISFSELRPVFHSDWFPTVEGRVSTATAVDRGLIPRDALGDDVFQTWVGLRTTAAEPPQPPLPRPRPNAKAVLAELSKWWTAEGANWTRGYERRLYPHGRLPALRDTFAERDHEERREWMSLLLLGSLHTMGRTRFEQHREFLQRCEIKGWLDIFADREQDASRWMEVLEQYLDVQNDEQEYYQWMRQFVGVFQLSRWLPEYVESFLSVNQYRKPFSLNALLAPRANPDFSGGGPDAPPVIRTLGIGASFVLRELVRSGVLHGPHVHRHCYVPVRRVCALLESLGCSSLASETNAERSKVIHAFLVEHMDEEGATFGGSFDLPLLALAEDQDLRVELLGAEHDVEYGRSDLPLGRDFHVFSAASAIPKGGG